ncbi:MAG: D-alanyl-D-alanine carboxypeptidase family protein [Oscillospiraceae bacterium]
MNFKRKLFSIISMIMVVVVTIPSASALAFEFQPSTGVDSNGKEIPLQLYSKAVYMENLDTGEVVVDTDSEEAKSPASLTKIMTAIVLLDHFNGNADTMKNTKVSAGTEAFDELYETGASTADIQPNEKVSYYDLLAALMIPSACEAANIIAVNIGGSLTKFCDMMNAKAKELNLKNTHFANAHGLFASKNYSCCKDIAVMCKYALDKYPVFAEIVSMDTYHMSATDKHTDGTDINNTNYMLNEYSKYYYPYVKGIKTGTLDSAGRCLASYAEKDGVSYLIVTMQAPLEKQAGDDEKANGDLTSVYADDVVYYNLIDHINLYNWAFDTLVSTDIVSNRSEIAEANVKFGLNTNYVTLKPKNGYTRLWSRNVSVDKIEQKITVADNVTAPIKAGDAVGKLELMYNGEKLATVPLVATSDVEQNVLKAKLYVAKCFFKSFEFKIALLIILGIFVIFTVIYIVRTQRKYLK